MYKNILIAACIIIIAWFSTRPDNTIPYKNTIDSIQAVLSDQKIQVSTYKEVVKLLDTEQTTHIHRADSLQELLKGTKLVHTCPEKVEILEEQVVELRYGLAKCNEAKVIQTKTIGVQDSIVTNTIEVVDIQLKSCEQKARKGKFRAFLTGMGVGGLVIGLLILL